MRLVRFENLLLLLSTCYLFGSPGASQIQAQSSNIKASPQELLFVDGETATNPSLTVKLPNSLPLLLQLVPNYDVDHQLFSFDLEVQGPNDKPDTNILEPHGHWHGMQPFIFVAMCFTKREAPVCGYPNPRVFTLRRLNLELRVRIADSSVELTPKATDYNDYRFKKLKLEIETVPLRKNPRQPSN